MHRVLHGSDEYSSIQRRRVSGRYRVACKVASGDGESRNSRGVDAEKDDRFHRMDHVYEIRHDATVKVGWTFWVDELPLASINPQNTVYAVATGTLKVVGASLAPLHVGAISGVTPLKDPLWPRAPRL